MAFDWVAGTALVVGIGSLILTWQSTRSAKRAIDTSIELYERQKQDEYNKKIESEKREKEAIRKVVAIELSRTCDVIVKLFELKAATMNGVSSVNLSCVDSTNVIIIRDLNGGRLKDIYIHSDANEIPIEIFFRTSVLCNDLYVDISEVKINMSILNKQLAFCYDYIKNADVSFLYDFLNNSGTTEILNQMYKTMKLFSKELEPYPVYGKLCSIMEEK
ncbi:hypothetical protein [Providencia stuartii]|uniref:hypothetical protein n=1 Tax=Providencia stuartii TaxID=588 RepID=UPI00335AAC55